MRDTGIPCIWGPDFFSRNAQLWVALSITTIGLSLHWPEEQMVSLTTPQQKGVECHTVGSSLCRSGSGSRALLLVPLTPTSASPRPLFSTLLPLATSVLRLPLCCPGLFLSGARRRPSARSRALVTTSRRAAPGAPEQPIGRPGAGAARGGAGKPISCS